MKIIDDGQVVISIAEFDRLRAADKGKIEISFKEMPRGFAAWIADDVDYNGVRYIGKDEAMKTLQAAYDESMSLKNADVHKVEALALERRRELARIDESFWYRLKVLFTGPKI